MTVIDQIKYYYHRAAATDWVRYMFYITVTIAVLVVFYIFVFRGKQFSRTSAGRIYNAKEATQAVAIDTRHFYAISSNSVGKYGRKSGKRLAHQKLPFRNLKNGKMVNGDLVLVDAKKGANVMVWLNPNDLSIIDVMDLPFIQGTLTWIDYNMGKWWLCDDHKKVKDTLIYCFSVDWNLEGFWKLPKKLVNEIEPQGLLGGAWFGEYLCVTGHDKPEMYILDLPGERVHASFVKKIQVCFDGHGFAFERGKGAVYAWGIRSDDRDVVRCEIDFDE